MAECLKCNNFFSRKTVVDGKPRFMSKRKYCLECSPFNSHNTIKLEDNISLKYNGIDACLCQKCGNEFIYDKARNMRVDKCATCVNTDQRKERKQKCLEYLGGHCCICNYNRCAEALHFHHTDPKMKKFGISQNVNRKWDSLQRELDKCVILCGNCHAEVHAGIAVLAA